MRLGIIILCLHVILFQISDVISANHTIYFLNSILDKQYLSNNIILNWNFLEPCRKFYKIVSDEKIDPDNEINTLQTMIYNKKNFVYLKLIRLNSEYTPLFDKTIPDTTFIEISKVTKIDDSEKLNTFLVGILISNSIIDINAGDLYNFISSAQYKKHVTWSEIKTRKRCLGYTENNRDLKTVLICTKYKDNLCKRYDADEIYASYKHLDIKFSKDDCKSDTELYKDSLLAVLTAKPFDVDEEIQVPVLIYNYSYLSQKTISMFPNSLSLVSPWWLLKFGFLDVLKEIGWSRVAIVSDDSPYSLEFKEQLVELFRNEGIPFATRGCDEEYKCDESVLKQALNSLEHINARIVIANVEEKYKHVLVKGPVHNFTWLTRDWSFTTSQQHKQKAASISLKLGPIIEDNDYHGARFNYECRGIIDGLYKISMSKRILDDYADISRKDYYRKLTNLIKDTISPSETTLYVKVVDGHYKDFITLRRITATSHGVSFGRPPYPDRTPLDRSNCIFKRNNFEEPCEDIFSVLNYMLVIIMFFITLLLITCYFHEAPSTSYQSI